MIKRLKIISWVLFILGLFYVALPGPSSINDFPALTPSVKSTLEGDTIQNPNIAAYYSDYRRDFITWFYKNKFAGMHIFSLIFPPVTINHPPERAYQYIRDQQESTFLEEYVYPLRYSFYVNGFEPFIENKTYNRPSNFQGNHIIIRDKTSGEEKYYDSKTTLRFYPTGLFSRVLVYVLIWLSGISLFRLYKEAFISERQI
ncbi:hypothetical protein A2617_04095 [Candidatus Daviesbacteria bacterium RIFOXYD1_FULL_41_10]|uniref:Uncharacterized protein n=2 Tax=Candidatus Daviesiibacteriota TaxID=1752718 RepID=A0A1F5N0E8_9BACT|nr:MAG: hypothetical protein US98_C0021G0005 [Parcubacteria group bacterium GW2011_GWC1_38_6]KKS14038.1 MAG: hypothetical protein UU67_C0009G0009 [Candidatus Daviesbacteria bacterium GW2011_GWB1_41_5]OGE71088.1 MAG: hypothetical protein A2617_04095 [Candidatus Daviesbacteria bacterium RIFOXYD1_FULL_41_10]